MTDGPIRETTPRGPEPRGVGRIRPGLTALIAGVLALAAVGIGERWYASIRQDLARERVEREASAVATSIQSVLTSRLAVLHGLASFLRLHWGQPDLDTAFDIFADGVYQGVPGLRTIQYVEGGIIRNTYPLRGNEAAIGSDLLADPRPALSGDYLRTIDTTGIVVSGPITLFQGGVGLVGRLAVRNVDDSVLVVAAVVIDFETLILEAGLDRAGEGLDLRLRSPTDSLLWSTSGDDTLSEPVRVMLSLPGQRWSLMAVPAGGWRVGAAAGQRAYWLGAGTVVLLIAGLAWGLQSRQRARVESTHLRELSRAEQKFRELFQLVPDGVIVVRESDHRVIEVNDAYGDIVQRARQDLLGRSTAELGIWAKPDERLAMYQALEHRDHVQDMPFLVSRTDGTTRESVVSSSRVTFDGEPCLLCVVRDVHDRLRLERRLVEGQRLEAVGRLAGGVAHDFNNLITGISGYSDLIFDSLDDDDERRREVAEIQRACTRASDLTRQLLTFARRQVVLPRVVDLNRVVREAAPLLRRLIEPAATLELVPAASPVVVVIDPAQFEQVLTNLAVNARDAMPDGGPVRIEVSRDDGQAIIAVSDQGTGIPPEALPHLFEPFYTTKPAGKGTGLGLATVYGIIEQAGGTIDVRSAVGRGSTFLVSLPLGGAELELTSETAPMSVMPRGSELILVVDDEPQIRDLGGRILARLGYQVLTESDGRAAIEVLERRPDVALVLTDMIMPGMGGWELVGKIRERRPEVRIVVMSGYSEDLVGTMGETPFLPKPFTATELARTVREALDRPVAPPTA